MTSRHFKRKGVSFDDGTDDYNDVDGKIPTKIEKESSKESKTSTSTKKYGDNDGKINDDQGDGNSQIHSSAGIDVDETIIHTKDKKPTFASTDPIDPNSCADKSRGFEEISRCEHFSSILDEFLDSKPPLCHLNSRYEGTEMSFKTVENQYDDKQSNTRIVNTDLLDFEEGAATVLSPSKARKKF